MLTAFQIKVVMNDHRQNFNSHIYQIKNTCIPMAENKTDPVIIFATHTHTHMHKTDFSGVDADNDAGELKVSHNGSHNKRVVVFNKNILSCL
jgi:hypothetical protein